MAEFKLPDPKQTSGKVLGIGLLGALGLVVYSYILPWLNTIVWGTIELAVGISIAAVLLYILLSPKFWKRMKIILDTFGEIIFRGFIEMNPFTIMELQLNKAEEDREELKEQAEKLKAQEDKLRTSLAEEKESYEESQEKVKILQQKIQRLADPNDYETPLELEAAANDLNNSRDYIEKITPIYNDISRLVQFADKAYTKSGYSLKSARNTVKKQRATYEAVTAGSNAMKKALRAFSGDPEINKAASIALEALKKDISGKVGAIKNSIQLTSQLMNERDLNDAAKVSLAVKKAQEINVDATFENMPVAVNPELQRINTPGTYQKNKWLDNLK